ncbi:MAG: SulP family inorganic anion transporter [Owenweeksia sp.]
MKTQEHFSPFKNLKYDLPSAIVVFLVAMPLCLGIALASEAPLFSGIIAGIAGGLVVTVASGSSLGVSGPAAGLIIIVVGAIRQLGFEGFLVAVVLAGIIQLIFGFMKAGIIGYYFPNVVIKGMLSAIGITIILKQIPHAVGYDEDFLGDLAFFQPDGHNTLSELSYMLDEIVPGALIITLVSLAILLIWERPAVKNHKILGIVQGPLIAVLAGVGLAAWFNGTSDMNIDPKHLVSLPVAGSFNEFLGLFTLPDFSILNNYQVYVAALTIAVVASIETLLCVEATDKMDPYKRITPTNRELKAQGLGNIASGLIGGLPVTQVIVRSSANIQSGGRTKASAFIHGLFLLITVLLIPNLLNMIPKASLAAILFLVGYKLAKPAIFKSVYKMGHEQFIPFIVTILGIVFTDLLKGIALGMVVAIFYILYKNYRVPYTFNEKQLGKRQDEPIRIELSEDVSFLNKAGILHTLTKLPDNTRVVIDGTRTRSIHPDVIEIIEDFKKNAETRNIEISVIGLEDEEGSTSVGKFTELVTNGQSNS